MVEFKQLGKFKHLWLCSFFPLPSPSPFPSPAPSTPREVQRSQKICIEEFPRSVCFLYLNG